MYESTQAVSRRPVRGRSSTESLRPPTGPDVSVDAVPTLPDMASPRWSLTVLLLLLSPLPRRSDALKLDVLSWSDHSRSTLDTAAVGNCAQCGVLCRQRQPGCLAVTCSADAGQCQLLGESLEIETTTEETETTTEPLCDTEWEEFGGACFRKVMEQVKYETAKTNCRGLRSGSDLASIHSAKENAFLQGWVGNHSFWIGLEHAALPEAGEYDFRWVDGTPLDFEHWRLRDQPNDPDKLEQPNDPTTMPLRVAASSAGLVWLDYRIGEEPDYNQLCKYTPER